MNDFKTPSRGSADPGMARAPARTDAERAKTYRQRKRAKGLAAVKCDLAPDALAYLRALCAIHDLTLSEVVAMAVTRMMRGDSPSDPSQGLQGFHTPGEECPFQTRLRPYSPLRA